MVTACRASSRTVGDGRRPLLCTATTRVRQHPVTLSPPHPGDEILAELANAEGYEGWTQYLLVGERGERKGKYLVMLEIASVEARGRYAPSEDGLFAEEAEALSSRNAALWERWRELATIPGEDTVFTDYVVVAQ